LAVPPRTAWARGGSQPWTPTIASRRTAQAGIYKRLPNVRIERAGRAGKLCCKFCTFGAVMSSWADVWHRIDGAFLAVVAGGTWAARGLGGQSLIAARRARHGLCAAAGTVSTHRAYIADHAIRGVRYPRSVPTVIALAAVARWRCHPTGTTVHPWCATRAGIGRCCPGRSGESAHRTRERHRRAVRAVVSRRTRPPRARWRRIRAGSSRPTIVAGVTLQRCL